MSSPPIPRFLLPETPRQISAPVVGSVVLHVFLCAWIYVGFKNVPRLTAPAPHRFTVRILNVPPPDPLPPVPPAVAQAAHVLPRVTAPQSAPSDQAAAPMPSVADTLAKLAPKPQILIQPDAPSELLIKPVPVPLALRWTAPALPVKVITPAPTQKSIVATLRPTIEPPNHELKPSDLRMTSNNSARALLALPPSTTSPIVVRGPDPAKRIPETSSAKTQQPTPAQIMSLSDVRMQPGPTPIPLANAPARPLPSTSLGNSAVVTSATNPTGQGAGQQPGSGAAKGRAGEGDKAATSSLPGPQTAAVDGPATAGSNIGAGSTPGFQTTAIHLPRDGQFGIVVVGSSLAEQYPETISLWAGRLVYTVYLHLGHGKAWIMQYSLPANSTAAAGNTVRPEAPWPYDLVEPHLDPDENVDAVMVHGFVNLAGRFERLNVVFPAQLPAAKFILSALQQWQFRPARQNGQLAPVEVLLIIPEQVQ
jgi:hypothetical protein